MNRSLKMAAFAIAALAPGASTYAQGTFIVNGKNYIVHRNGIPDYDQRKMSDAATQVLGLPNNGSMYCVPTAALNNLSYLANHGYPLLSPSQGDWSSSLPAVYNHVTGSQFHMGQILGTDAVKGTFGGKGLLQDYLDSIYPGQFAVTEIFDSTNYAPSIYDGAIAMLNGSLVNICYGWYKKDTFYNWKTFDYEKFYYRDGGHCVTMVGAQDWNGTVNVSLHDPANPNDGSVITQSFFQDDISTYQNITATFSWKDTFAEDEDKFSRTMQIIDYSGGFLDSIMKISPKLGYTYQDDDIIFMTPNSPNDDRGLPERPPYTLINTGIGRKITHLAIDPFSELTTLIAEDTDALFTFNPVTKQVERVLEVSKPKQVVFDTDGNVIVLRDAQLDLYNRQMKRKRNVGLSQKLDSIAWEPASGRLVGYSRKANALYYFDKQLNRQGNVPLPGMAAPPEKASLFFDDAGVAYIIGQGSRQITKVAFGRSGAAEVSKVAVPTAVGTPDGGYVDESGRIFLTVQGSVVPLNRDGGVDRTSKFFGMPAGESMQILRPFANKKLDAVKDPGYRNVLPPFVQR